MRHFILTLLLMCSALTMRAMYVEFSVDGISYNRISDTEVEVTGGPLYYGSVVIPESVTYEGVEYTVTTLGHMAFAYSSNLTAVELPNTITTISNWAFYCCSKLTSITIPASVVKIIPNPFDGCTRLASITVDSENPIYDSRENCNAIIETATNTLAFGCYKTVIPTSVTALADNAFLGCNWLKTLVIPESVTSIGRGVFSKCQALKSVTIPNSVTSIGNGAFNGCTQLPSLVIPSSVTYIGDRIVTYCNNLTNLQVEQGNPVYDSRDNCNAIIETASNTLVDGCGSTVIPNTVTGIGFGAFEMCKALKSLIIPNSVTHIDGWVFHCSNLESVEIPNSVTSIGETAFAECHSLTNIVIPNSVTSIGHDAFAWCYGLKCVEIPGYADSVGTGVFNYCDALTRVICRSVFPPSVSFGFEGNTSITLFVPIAGLELYKSDPIWGLVPHIEPFLGAGPGDINGDGQFGISDVTGMIDLLLNGGKLPAYADVNGDGKVSITDVTALIDMLLNGN